MERAVFYPTDEDCRLNNQIVKGKSNISKIRLALFLLKKVRYTNMRTEDYEKQAIDFMEKTDTKIKIEYEKYDYHFYGDVKMRNVYKVVIKRKGKQMTVHFGQSLIKTASNTPPTYYDILACLIPEDPGTLFEFCDCFGYDPFEENTIKIHKLCVREWQKVNNLFSDVIDELREIR